MGVEGPAPETDELVSRLASEDTSVRGGAAGPDGSGDPRAADEEAGGMELRDYVAALRRYWTTWVAVTVAAVLVALTVVLGASPSYSATATVFVAATSDDGTSSAQFVKQRVVGYPDVARSQAVLGPVIDDGNLSETAAELRTRIEATNPPDSSQIDITVTDGDPARAASVANAVAEEFGRAVEELERPREGTTPVDLTVTDPATVPAMPVFPQPGLVLGLGLVVGLALGAAAAVLRSRTDPRLHTADDVRTAWGAGAEEVTVLVSPDPRRRAGRMVARPAALVARRLAPLAEDRPVRVLVLSAVADDEQTARAFAREVAEDLVAGGVPADPTGPVDGPLSRRPTAGVQLSTGTPLIPLHEWRRIGREYDRVVLVAESGRVDRADLQEIRSLLTAAESRLLAVVLAPHRSRSTGPAVPQTAPAQPAAPNGAPGPARKVSLSGR